MGNGLTIIIPFWHGHKTLPVLLDSIPHYQPVIVVNDYESKTPYTGRWPNVRVINLEARGYFSGACNAGFDACGTDVLILNQDGKLRNGWQSTLDKAGEYGLIGDGVMGHPAWPNGYIQGTYMFIRRDVLEAVGGFDVKLYPLWGATAEYQLRACRAGFKALPLDVDSYFYHAREGRAYGKAIARTLEEQPDRKRDFIKTPPEISVIITVYNYGRYLKNAVQSVLDQTFSSTEIIIVDDGSTDNTQEIGRGLHDPWKGIHYIRQDNAGASAAANTGIEKAKGRYITVLDGDDWMERTRLERMHAVAEANPHSVVYDNVWFVTQTGLKERRMRPYDFEKLLNANMMHKGILYPKKAWLEAGGYSNQMNNGREDWEFNIRLGLAGWCGVHLDEFHYFYRREGQGRTQRNGLSRAYFKDKIIALHRKIYEGDRPMACCGGRREPTRPTTLTTTTLSTAAIYDPGQQPADGWVLVEYTGVSIGNQNIWGPSRTRYKYGRNERNLRFWVHPDDIDFLINEVGTFKVYKAPAPAPAPEPTSEPEPEPLPDPAQSLSAEAEPTLEPELAEEAGPVQEPEPIPEATSYAQRLADQTGIDLRSVPHDGVKIGVGDVRAYLDEQGIDY